MIDILKIQSPMNAVFTLWAFLWQASFTIGCIAVLRGIEKTGHEPAGRSGCGRGLLTPKHFQLAEAPAPDD